jgi:tRNA A37 N6-isopentenylltransferase MiaA
MHVETPILVGGTMLYFKALLEGFLIIYQCRSKIRAEIEQKANEKGGKLFMMNYAGGSTCRRKSLKFQINNELFGH